ncbi:MAG: sodium:proton antiporter [Chloroflexota bacterium]|nr:sodium:proton antiporter [Chloroflexota bacterium]
MTTAMTQTIARLLFLPALMVALATLVKGYADTGDGFTAGVIAALAVLLQVVAFGVDETERRLPLHAAPAVAFAGVVLALVVAFLPVLFGRPIMTHAPAPGSAVIHLGTLELITAVAFDVGVFLLVLGFAVSTIGLIARLQPRETP